MSDRFMFVPFWRLTRFGFLGWPRPQRGCDEFHNRSIYVVIPLIGEVVFFFEPRMHPRTDEHIGSLVDGVIEGLVVEDCRVCGEILASFILEGCFIRDYRPKALKYHAPADWMDYEMYRCPECGGPADRNSADQIYCRDRQGCGQSIDLQFERLLDEEEKIERGLGVRS